LDTVARAASAGDGLLSAIFTSCFDLTDFNQLELGKASGCSEKSKQLRVTPAEADRSDVALMAEG
jgi:hypothetical protein